MPPDPGQWEPPDRERALVESAREEAGAWRKTAPDGAPWSWRPGDEVFPGYELRRELHRGGQGVVYEALQRSTHRTVAIKVLLAGELAGEQSRLRFEREVRVLAGLRHSNIVVIHDSGIARGCRFLVMDLVVGEHLDVYCHSRSLTPAQIVRLLRPVVDAIGFAHERGIVHRDLKPANIIVAKDGTPYVLDFGLAKGTDHVDGVSLTRSLSEIGDLVGTLRYMSPEQVAGDSGSVDTSTDVHALSVVLYELLTGSHPYGASATLSAFVHAIQYASPPRISVARPEVDAELERVVLKGLAKKPVERYRSAVELGRALDGWLRRCGQDGIDGRIQHARGLRRNRRVWLWPVLVFTLAVSAVLIAHISERGPAVTFWPTRDGSSYQSATDSAPETERPVALLDFIRQNGSLRCLSVRPVSGADRVRIEGTLLNESELQILTQRLKHIEDRIELEVHVNPESTRVLLQRALVEAGGRDIRVRLEGPDGQARLNVEVGQTDSLPMLESVARSFVFDQSSVRIRAH